MTWWGGAMRRREALAASHLIQNLGIYPRS
jgi:hypothetical protein